MWLTNVKTAAIRQWWEAEALMIFCLKAQTIESADFVLDLEKRTAQNGSTICWGVGWTTLP